LGFYRPNQIEEVVLVDGVFLFSTKENSLQYPFDENYSSFHFYDLDFSLNLFNSGKINYVTNSIQIEHFSSGSLNQQWVKSSKLYSSKWPMGIYKSFNHKKLVYNFEKLAFNSHLETLFINKYYLETFKLFIFNMQYISIKICFRIFKTLLNG
jgi:GT2 family glycosyltransferase